MRTKIEIDPAARLVVSTLEGEFSVEALAESRKELAAAPLFDPSYSIIVDLSHVNVGSIGPEQIKQLALGPSVVSKDSVQVLVVPDPAGFQLARLFQAYTAETRPNIHVVKTLEEAYSRVRGLKRLA